MERAMPTIADTKQVSKPAPWISRSFGGLAVVLLLFEGAVKWVPWPIVTETMDRMANGSSETLARGLGLISIVCTALCAVPPTSIVGAILWTGYLGGAVASHVRIDGPLFSHILLGVYLGVTVWSGTWLRNGNLRMLLPFSR
jgi:hypothetical protein